MADRVALVTGGSRGIGRATVMALARGGARVAFSSRTQGAESEGVIREAAAAVGPGAVEHIVADASDEREVDAMFDQATRRFGPIDLVVSNAGTSRGGLLVSLDERELDAVLATNLTGAFLVARRAVRAFGRYPGALVIIGSLAQHGSPANAAYAASKGALLGLTQSILAAHGDHVRAYLAIVGFVETALTHDLPTRTRTLLVEVCPQRRAATADEVAAAILGLVDAPGARLDGEPLYVTGGLAEIPS